MYTPIHKVADILRRNALLFTLLALPTTMWGQTFISNVNASALDTSAVITWTTAVPASSQVKYGTSSSYGKSSSFDGTMALQHSATISGLTASTTYHFTVVSADSSGEQVASPDSTFTTSGSAPAPAPLPPPPSNTSGSRGYVTTPAELQAIAAKAAQGIEPYRSAVLAVKKFADTSWPYGTISGSQSCTGVQSPAYIGGGAPLVEAKAMAYWLTGDETYAADARIHILDLTDTSGYGGDVYSGANQCILNLSREFPPFVIAADLLEDYPGWSASDKQAFQQWLATVVYKKVDFANDAEAHNWGAAGSSASAMIADYLTGSGILLVDRDGATISSHDAWAEAKQRSLDRRDGNTYMKNVLSLCPSYDFGKGIRPDGGIPWELVRGSSGCDALWIVDLDKSWTYMQAHLTPAILQAEIFLRRGDPSLYTHIASNGAGSLLRGVYFLIRNPNDVTKSVSWSSDRKGPLEYMYRFYATQGWLDPYIAVQLGIGGTRVITATAPNQTTNFTTLTHGFAVGETPAPVPVTPAP